MKEIKKKMRKSHTKTKSSPSYTKAAGSRKITLKAISIKKKKKDQKFVDVIENISRGI